ncbi:DUF1205 domain-containing protein [Paractinoplanes ferrugineus]|uniref:Glycosyl transferase n=1 Tax=Paractinoplanes ferrugineus TaxID=113564 RepID=A0A919J495_9ACTN|nr:nucleotide disphospho-sugar-binding domain-containing protein [Actinoplanes ferrugineus]GIE13703.1 glycosyl transferase [Actinoplanes ferrugineus]
MRVLFVNWGWQSHLFPMVPLAWACRAAGHEVRVATQPGLVPVAAATGLPVVPVGADVDVPGLVRGYASGAPVPAPVPSAAGPSAPGPTGPPRTPRALAMVVALAEAMTPDLLRLARDFRPDLLVFETTTWAGPLVAGALGVPSARFLYGVDMLHAFRGAAAGALAPLTGRLGIDRVDVGGDLVVDPAPESLRLPVDYRPQPIRYVPYNGTAAAAPVLPPRGDRPRVCVTWGTTMSKLGGQRFLAGEVGRLIGADHEVLYAVTDEQAGQLGEVPPGAIVCRSVPLHLVLETCAAVVHHGGAGTMLTALTAGLPQVIVPQLPDHATHARQLTGAGAGLTLDRAGCDAPGLREALAALLGEPSFGVSARAAQRQMHDHPTPVELVPVLEKLAGV